MSELILNQVKGMDVTTEEFFKLYAAITEKYWTFEDPDDEQTSRRLLYMIAERGEFEQVATLVRMFQQLLTVTEKGGTVAAEIGFKDKTFYFKIADEPDGMDRMKKVIQNTVMVQGGSPDESANGN